MFSANFANESDWGGEITAHPFDTHPPSNQRLQALGVDLTPEFVRDVLAKLADEAWYRKIDDAEVIENRLWMAYQQRFRASHEVSLSYRYLGENDEERDHIEPHFPPQTIALPKDTFVVIDYEKVSYSKWKTPVYWAEVLTITAENDLGTYVIQFSLNSNNHEIRKFPLPKKQAEIARITQILGKYFGRYQSAESYKESQTGER